MTMIRQGPYTKYSPDLNPYHGLVYITTRKGKATKTGIKRQILKT